ncbi:hypothetical protein GUJ93_ZPchr0012g21707 [Zizania palustris]|uniref:Uncharacterized protein n=1 Tax=Zizania palustris TaxID=103762 RepID=A0A8J6BYZ9_ZIZPA|nr:hypothetical protein GUJ93_ZPchr0012g21707 [Zizania palustris]
MGCAFGREGWQPCKVAGGGACGCEWCSSGDLRWGSWRHVQRHGQGAFQHAVSLAMRYAAYGAVVDYATAASATRGIRRWRHV